MAIKVLIVDDSALVRRMLTEMLSQHGDIKVVGAAPDPFVARDMIKTLQPDVLTLDVEMPRMDGLDFLRRLMQLHPMPVVMVSSLTEQGSDATLRALELGAVDFVSKPKADISGTFASYAQELVEKIRVAATAKVRRIPVSSAPPAVMSKLSADAVLAARSAPIGTTEKLIMIGASTGGTEAIKTVLADMPADSPAILITQHMPEKFTASFARRLDSLSRLHVKEAQAGERILPGHAYLAPGHSHLLLARSGANYVVELSQGPAVNRHRPSVDVLFRSAANVAGRNAVGVILTGMGADGAEGLLEMRQAGSPTIAQDEASCVVFGMPREAIARSAAVEVLPLEKIASRLIQLVHAGGRSIRT
jgi:two-component system chemotaxis response regulator CheB